MYLFSFDSIYFSYNIDNFSKKIWNNFKQFEIINFTLFLIYKDKQLFYTPVNLDKNMFYYGQKKKKTVILHIK